MSAEETLFSFDRDYPEPAEKVWRALVDQRQVGGWLARAVIEPVDGGRYDLVWLSMAGSPKTQGTIVRLSEPRQLVVQTDNRGLLEFQLDELDGGEAGTRLTVAVHIAVDPVFATRVTADWETSLDQLGDLLQGHPVDWVNWDQERGPGWHEHLRRARSAEGG